MSDRFRERASSKTYKITGIGENTNIEKRYFLIEGTILPRQGITKVTSGYSRWKFWNKEKYYLTIHYGWFSHSYTFRFEMISDRNCIMTQLLKCVNYDY